MATREELLAEAYRRGLMPPQQRAAYEEAQRRGIVKGPAASSKPAKAIDTITGALATFNRNALPFMDEAADGLQAVSNLVQGRAGSLPQAWQQARKASSGAAQRFEAAAPRAAALTRGVGLATQAALPAGVAGRAVAAAPTLGTAMLRSGVAGATAGGVGGYAAGEGPNRGRMTLQGAAAGGALGAAVPAAVPAANAAFEFASPFVQNLLQRAAPMVEDVGRAIPAVDDLAGSVAAGMRRMAPDAVSALPTPEQIALRHINRNLQSSGLTVDDLRAAPQGITAAEAMGRTGQRQLGSIARMEGETADELEGLISARVQGRPGALSDAFGRATGVDPDAAAGNIDAVVEAGRRRAAPLYEQAYADTIDVTPTLQGLTQRPAVQKAMRNARQMMQNDGLDPDALGLTVSPQSGEIPIMEVSKRPSMQLWDYVKRGLDDEIDDLRDPVTKAFKRPQEARQLTDMASTLRGELTSQSPAYRQALETSGDYLKADAAFKNAPRLVFNDKLSPRAFAQQVAKMTEGEREALRAGIANHALNLVDSGRMKPRAFSTPGVRQKLGVILGDDGARGLIETAELEARKAAFENRYGPGAGSVTSDMLAGGEEVAQSVGGGPLNVGRMFMDPLGSLRAGGEALINKGVDLATLPGQTAARDAIGKLYLNDPRQLAAYLDANPVNVPPPVFPGMSAPNPLAFTPRAAGPSPRPRSSR